MVCFSKKVMYLSASSSDAYPQNTKAHLAACRESNKAITEFGSKIFAFLADKVKSADTSRHLSFSLLASLLISPVEVKERD